MPDNTPQSEIRNSKSEIGTSEIRNPTLPDRSDLLTEQRLAAAADLDALNTEGVLRVINDEDATIAAVVRAAIPAIATLVDAIVVNMAQGGRLIYLGAGTSGRLGVLDASECPPTFQSNPDQVVGLIAGGDSALRKSSEGMEDDLNGAAAEFKRINLDQHDTLIGIAAGGTTPYVRGGIVLAKQCGTTTALMCCVTRDELLSNDANDANHIDAADADNTFTAIDHLIALPVGPEVVTGSTRMKAGTVTKLALNMISTCVMVQRGKTWGNLMVDLRATNDKLRDRAARILTWQCKLPRDEALALLDRAAGQVKLALIMHFKDVNAAEAEQLLQQHNQQLRPILGAPVS